MSKFTVGLVSLVCGAVLGFVASALLQPYFSIDDFPGVRELYHPSAQVVPDSQNGVRLRALTVHSSRGQQPGHQFVIWMTMTNAEGKPDLTHVWPYGRPEAGTTSEYKVAVGGVKPEVGSFFAQVCDVHGDALARVDSYFSAIVIGHAPSDDRASQGINISEYRDSIRCTEQGTAKLQRTS
jgi:hypothetical protein